MGFACDIAPSRLGAPQKLRRRANGFAIGPAADVNGRTGAQAPLADFLEVSWDADGRRRFRLS
jgi:hypothetical protein